MTDLELVYEIAYGPDGGAIPDELMSSGEPSLFKMIRLLARELLLLETVYEADNHDD